MFQVLYVASVSSDSSTFSVRYPVLLAHRLPPLFDQCDQYVHPPNVTREICSPGEGDIAEPFSSAPTVTETAYVSSFADVWGVHELLSLVVCVRSRRNPRCALSSLLFSLHDVWSSAMVAVYSRSLCLHVRALVDVDAKKISL